MQLSGIKWRLTVLSLLCMNGPLCGSDDELVPAGQLARQWRRTKSLAEPEEKVRKGMSVVEDGGVASSVKPLEITVDARTLASFRNIQFGLNSAEIEEGASRAQLAEIARAMQSAGDERFLIEGHTCDRGGEELNANLSRRRAQAVRDALVALGVDGSRLQSIGCGQGDPIAPNTDEQARAKNRRVQIFRRI
jgi:outer membrane protein OmpA-like peptidoglycan-associated protein